MMPDRVWKVRVCTCVKWSYQYWLSDTWSRTYGAICHSHRSNLFLSACVRTWRCCCCWVLGCITTAAQKCEWCDIYWGVVFKVGVIRNNNRVFVEWVMFVSVLLFEAILFAYLVALCFNETSMGQIEYMMLVWWYKTDNYILNLHKSVEEKKDSGDQQNATKDRLKMR